MKYQDKRDGEIKETDYLKVMIGDNSFRIELENDQLVITKYGWEDSRFSIQPVVSNQIRIS